MNEEEKELAEVGAKVMGWCKSTHGRTWIGKNGEYAGYMQPHTDFGVKWNPAQRVEQAFMVVMKLGKDDWLWNMTNSKFATRSDICDFRIWKKLTNEMNAYVGKAQCPALAIMRAVRRSS